ncbi:unnamed protein product [Rodentolepis nana]|uniref:ZM domain-containing protein n=1 Tax=Rodentolepis nana TaxID=102285 RepID=A0A0R3TLZ6_RODNA|nr:unnamed protein product [Rodentolepis nana]
MRIPSPHCNFLPLFSSPFASQTNRKLHELRSSIVAANRGDMDQESPHRGLLARLPQSLPPTAAATRANQGSVEYAELAFNPSTLPPGGGGAPRKNTVEFATMGRTGSAPKLKRGPAPGSSSASMQQLPRSHTQGSEESENNYTEIIGVLQPKAYTSQLVLKQQQEATQAILGMHSNSPSVFV